MKWILLLMISFNLSAQSWEKIPTSLVSEIRDSHANHMTRALNAVFGKKEIKLTRDGKNYLIKLPNSEVEEILLHNGELVDLTRLSKSEIQALLKEARVLGGTDGGGG